MKLFTLSCAALAALLGFNTASAEAEIQSTVYFLAAGPRISQAQPTPDAAKYESFVVPVRDPDKIAQIRSLIQHAEYPVVNVRIQAANDGTNRDFYGVGAPVWNWSVVELLAVQGGPRNVFLDPSQETLPEENYGSVSMIAADPHGWITRHGDQLAQQWFPLTTEINPFKTPLPLDPEAPVMANLSTRAITGKGQDIFIGGISISGSRPKQVAVRSSGNDLLGEHGVFTAVGNPRVRVYAADGTQLVSLKSERDYELIARFPELVPRRFIRHVDTLAIITLYPGQYTFHVFDENDHTGVVLFELYDLSLAPQPFP